MINSLEELKHTADKKRDLNKNAHEELRICTGSSCSSLGSNELLKDLAKKVKDTELDKRCRVKGVGCNGLCAEAIMVSHYHKVGERESIYSKVDKTNSDKFIETLHTKTP